MRREVTRTTTSALKRGDPTRLLVADGDADSRVLVAAALRTAGFAAIEAGSHEAAIDVAVTRRPALAISEVQLPGGSGYELCRRLLELQPPVPVIFLSGGRTESCDRVAGLLIGAEDYLVKPFDPEELIARVRVVLRRRSPLLHEGLQDLTQRELEVLQLLADGLDQRQIATRLTISGRTVGTHIEHILSKLGVHSRAQAVAFVRRLETREYAPVS